MRNRPWLKWVLIGVGVVVILVVAVPFVYINFIKKDRAAEAVALGRADRDDPAEREQHGRPAGANSSIDGTYKVSSGSQAGYRAKEVLFGQSADRRRPHERRHR